jgi:probable rRNA maturation factor
MALSFSALPPAQRWLPPKALSRLERKAQRMLTAASLTDPSLGKPTSVECGLTLTSDEHVHRLNREYRRKNKPTDVLAFAMREGQGPHFSGLLGDVVISVETARRQAKATLEEEVAFLWAHGLCHLLGYDHQTDAQERAMNQRMAGLLAEGARRGKVHPA